MFLRDKYSFFNEILLNYINNIAFTYKKYITYKWENNNDELKCRLILSD